jgi:hypothetical protein
MMFAWPAMLVAVLLNCKVFQIGRHGHRPHHPLSPSTLAAAPCSLTSEVQQAKANKHVHLCDVPSSGITAGPQKVLDECRMRGQVNVESAGREVAPLATVESQLEWIGLGTQAAAITNCPGNPGPVPHFQFFCSPTAIQSQLWLHPQGAVCHLTTQSCLGLRKGK